MIRGFRGKRAALTRQKACISGGGKVDWWLGRSMKLWAVFRADKYFGPVGPVFSERSHSRLARCGGPPASVKNDRPMSSSNPADLTSLTLLEKAQRNDSEAWERLVGLYTPLVFYWCKRIGLEQPDAEEVGQEVFLAVARALPAFDHAREGATFRGWLRVITRRKAIDLLGRKSVGGAGGTTAMQLLAEVPAAEEQPEEAIETGLLYRRGVELIDSSFEPTSRQAFWLLVDGMSVQEVSDRLGISLAAVYTAKSKILKKLREEFRGLLNPDSDRPAAAD